MAKGKPAAPSVQTTFAPTTDGYSGKVLWQPNPGPQEELLFRPEYELLYGGAKGGGKSAGGRAWLLKGNPVDWIGDFRGWKPRQPENPADISYINHRDYRALVVRLNRKDADNWIDKGMNELYGPMGAKFTGSPSAEIEFPTGAKIIVDHIGDDSIWTKYAGVEYQRMVFEEANQIPNYERYSMVAINCRSSFPELRPQILLTANPNGPGAAWLAKRFLPKRLETHRKTIREHRLDPFTGEKRMVTRVFIPAKLSDNPKMLSTDPDYGVRLMSQLESKAQERALLHGDWNALEGQFFDTFRPAHIPGEPANAVHVIPSGVVQLAPYYHRWIGMDWGFGHSAAVYWACHDPGDDRVHIYREMVRKGVGAREWGRIIARASVQDIEGQEKRSMTLFLSPDAFARRNDEKTIAEQMQWGMEDVLGPASCELIVGDTSAGLDFFESIKFQRSAGIRIQRANHERVAGWEYMRGLMRFMPLASRPVSDKFNPEYALNLAMTQGSTAYFRYLAEFQQRAKEDALPKLQIHDCCRKLIDAIPSAMYDKDGEDVLKTNEEHDDVLDAIRYTLMAHKNQKNREPKSVFVENHLKAHGITEEGRAWASLKAAEDYEDQTAQVGFSISRMSGRRSRVM